MSRFWRTAFLMFMLTWLLAATGMAAERTLIVTASDHSLGGTDDCEHFHTQTMTSFPAQAQAQEQREVAMTGLNVLKIRTIQEGGILVKGWDKPNARLMICKSAVSETQQRAQRILDSVTVTFKNGEIAATGPVVDETQLWWVNMILFVPKKMALDIASENGGIAVRNMAGKITARARNGGISLAQCDGEHKVTTENGGISLERLTGRIEANTQNGPISLRLRDAIPALEARTEDEIVCNVKGGTWTADRKTLRLGSRAPSVRLTTLAAPIMIEQVR